MKSKMIFVMKMLEKCIRICMDSDNENAKKLANKLIPLIPQYLNDMGYSVAINMIPNSTHNNGVMLFYNGANMELSYFMTHIYNEE